MEKKKIKKPIKCTKCGEKIPKSETPAYLQTKRVCQDCYEKRYIKAPKFNKAWWRQWSI